MMKTVKTVAKAIAGGVVAAAAFLIPVIDDGLKTSEILGALVAALVGTGIVYLVPNTPKTQVEENP